MPDLTGAQRVVLSQTLWSLVVPLLLGLAWHVGIARSKRVAAAGEARSIRYVGMMAVGLSAGATLGHAAALMHRGRPLVAFVEAFGGGLRVGSLHAGFALSFDPFSAVACTWVALVALCVACYFATRRSAGDWRVWAWIELALAGALLTCMADGFVTMALGWVFGAIATACLAGWTNARAAVRVANRGAAALVTLLIGAALLFWGLGGSWSKDEYLRDVQPPFAAINTGSGPGPAAISLPGSPGALVFVDRARTPVIAPFAGLPLSAGRHELRVHAGAAADDVMVDLTVSGDGATMMLVASGPSLSLRDVAEVMRATDPALGGVSRRGLSGRSGPFGFDLVAATLAVWAFAAWAMRAAPPAPGVPRALSLLSLGATTTILGPALLARATVLVPLSPRLGVLLAAVGLATLSVSTVALWRALTGRPAGPAKPPALAWLERAPRRMGTLLLRFERWVVDPVASAADGLLGALAWTVVRMDAHFFRSGH